METNQSGKWFQFHIPNKWNNFAIENILKEEWKVPKKLLHEIRMDKGVRINGDYINWNIPLKTNDIFEIAIFQDEDYGVIPQNLSIEVLYEDDHLIIVNKPAGIDTHPNVDGQKDTLANGVAYYFQEKKEYHRVRHIHRLDRDTSGAILFAKHALSHAILDRLLHERKIKRTYYALVQGIIRPSSFVIDDPIGRDRHHPTKRRVSKSGQTAITRATVLKIFPKEKFTLIECSLDTGRTHQIRVHLSSIGHPLVGDTLYGGKPIFKRQALHARKLSFVHPFLGQKVECIAPFNDPYSIFEKFQL
ncbi:RluA family pseudouridine synthase [Heyndrickxia sporothermodurans]|uniref:Pseudouridine synthase n=1 Tax=Heyndrickxia sporothermodurans TaxID=46224 RepID=A0AB37HKX0_9BACI|nr:RluA family pseudouridine synthase [Heyndrickxia sporothermodurans]MBL5781171.1 RluA family pseudouridine synthase [Heyndrickxia sporothermodurans]MBL5791850.1 RluA family pseudouridine synthase [Heyndrickxia sporothermodurans]MBL5802885.1 RluA family pseudouridine synthase [Heyndrickxia sporothermodurans]MBL5865695.1 RluA family pseudouridine synthase [Heyndrickxia sporothermodurans]MBL7246375.1 RluA family pseudouridine synthase [Heyndrickxia sporothermodurans]